MSSSLGIFEILYRTLKHRWDAVIPDPFPLSAPGRVSDPLRAQLLLEQYTTICSDLASFYVQRHGEAMPQTLPPAIWPGTVPNLIEAISQLRFTRRTVLDVDVMVPLAKMVKDQDVIGTWAVPRFFECRRVVSTTLEVRHGNVSRPTPPHPGTNQDHGAVEARYIGQPIFYRESAPIQVHDGGTGSVSFQFPLPPGHCDCGAEYFLEGQFTRCEIEINGRILVLDSDAPYQFTVDHILADANLFLIRPWAGRGSGSSSWGPIRVVRIRRWRSTASAPDAYTEDGCTWIKLGPRPWGNPGGRERVSFTLEGVVEAFEGGPLSQALPKSFPAPRVDCWPRFLEPGFRLHLGFNAPSQDTFVHVSTLNNVVKAEGIIFDEITKVDFVVDKLPYLNRVRVTAGSESVLDTVFGEYPGTHPDYYGGGYGYGRNGNVFCLDDDALANLL